MENQSAGENAYPLKSGGAHVKGKRHTQNNGASGPTRRSGGCVLSPSNMPMRPMTAVSQKPQDKAARLEYAATHPEEWEGLCGALPKPPLIGETVDRLLTEYQGLGGVGEQAAGGVAGAVAVASRLGQAAAAVAPTSVAPAGPPAGSARRRAQPR